MVQHSVAESTQITYARLAGFVYLLLIGLFMGGGFLISHIVGNGDFASKSANVLASMPLYRGALVLEVLASLFTVVLAYALYTVVRPVNERLAQMALYWRLGEAFIGAAFSWISYVELGAYTSGLDPAQAKPLLAIVHITDVASFNITTLMFSFDSSIFFYLFFKSAYLPKVLAAFGVFASCAVTAVSLIGLVLPEHATSIRAAWIPIFAAEIITGFWLLFLGVRVRDARLICEPQVSP